MRRARDAGQRVRVAASGHSFTSTACTDGRMLRLEGLDRIVGVDPDASTVTVEAGIHLWALNEALAARGYALPNLGDIDRQTFAGATATATHGTGLAHQGIASAIRAMEIVTADGEVLRCSPDEEPEVFHCARVGVGALGIVTQVTLGVVPEFRLHSIEKPRRFDEFVAEWDELVETNDHVDSYWFPHTDTCTAKLNNRTDLPVRRRTAWKEWRDEMVLTNGVFGASVKVGKAAPKLVPGIMRQVANSIGKTEVVDRSDRVFCSRRLVRFVEMEYSIPRAEAMKGLLRIRELIEGEGFNVSFPVEIRALGGDDIPLSTAYGDERGYLAVHLPSGTDVEPYFHGVEAIMDEVGGRPHWGKLHYQSAATLAGRYPEWERFAALRRSLDPEGVFANAYTQRVLG